TVFDFHCILILLCKIDLYTSVYLFCIHTGDIMDGSLEVAVVFIDTDYHLDMLRLVSVLEGRLAKDSSFYWVDRFNGGESTVCQEANLRKCAELNYGSDPGVSEVPSSSSSSSSRRWRSADSATDFDKPYLCKAWQRIVTHRMLFTKSHVSKEHKQVFPTACTSIMIKGVKDARFISTEFKACSHLIVLVPSIILLNIMCF
uniref:X-ray repair cross complementing 2 n=1 Tax=Cyprinus carpio TaxID=7962 RepID=A0A8C2J442_CYPCA